MIKLNRLPDPVMDMVMELVREHNIKPDKVIEIMLGLVDKIDAKKAINNEQNLQG